jgi:hypothetical protein
MWLRSSQWILSSKSPSRTYLQVIQQYRTQISRNPLGQKPRRSIKNFDESNILRVEPRTEPHASRLLIRPTIFTIGVCRANKFLLFSQIFILIFRSL